MVLMGRNESTFNAIYHENSCCILYGLFKPIPIRAILFSKPLSKKKKKQKKKDQMIRRSPARVLIQDLQDVLVGPTCSGLDER